MPAWLRGHARLSPAAAGRLVRSGRALEHLPAVAEAFAAGEVTAEQVAVIAPVTTDEALAAAAAQDVDLGEVDTALATVATTQPFQRLGEVVHRYLDALDPDGPEPDSVPSPAASTWTRSAGRESRPRWSPSCRPPGRRGTPGPGASSRPTPWSSCATTPWPQGRC